MDLEYRGVRGDLVGMAVVRHGSAADAWALSASASRAFIGPRLISTAGASTAIRVANVGRAPASYSVIFLAPDASILYEAENPVLQPDEDRLVDIDQLREQGIADKHGRRIPLTTDEGSFEVRASSGESATLFAAAASPAGTEGGIVPAYYEECCGYVDPYIDPGSFTGPVGSIWSEEVYVMDTCTYDYESGGSVEWSIDNWSIVTMRPQGDFEALTPGSTSINADVAVWMGGPVCGEIYFQRVSAGANVVPRIDSIDPTTAVIGSKNVQITINGSGFGSSPSVNLPSGFTSTGQGSTDTRVVITVNIAFTATVGIDKRSI